MKVLRIDKQREIMYIELRGTENKHPIKMVPLYVKTQQLTIS